LYPIGYSRHSGHRQAASLPQENIDHEAETFAGIAK